MKQIESSNSGNKYRKLIENSLQRIVIIQDFQIMYANPAFARITGYSIDELLSFTPQQVMELAHPDDRETIWANFRKRMAGTDVSPHYQFKALSKAGKTKVLELYANKIEYNGKPAIQGFILDITERIKTEIEIQNSLREKEILLREVHHRVKNNLQTITSLLDLQAESIKDEGSRKAFKSSQSRIRSMALIHEGLYKSENLERIKAQEHIQHLIEYLRGTYQTNDANIEIKTNVENLYLNLDTAIPCGLIINELVSNSMKYAFRVIQRGVVIITLQKLGTENLTLKVADNGTGIPNDVTLASTKSLGLQLVNFLTEQLNGKLKIDRTDGTAISVSFPVQPGIEEVDKK
ncbi:MAG: PAS domain S-box protein [Ignavibacteria bacterium]|nr:PAS domain S-box protein [Ignavibacteria bacterium]